MATYLIGHITVKGRDKWERYVEGVARSLEHFDAHLVFRGRRAAVLAGAHPHELTVVIEFADQGTGGRGRSPGTSGPPQRWCSRNFSGR